MLPELKWYHSKQHHSHLNALVLYVAFFWQPRQTPLRSFYNNVFFATYFINSSLYSLQFCLNYCKGCTHCWTLFPYKPQTVAIKVNHIHGRIRQLFMVLRYNLEGFVCAYNLLMAISTAPFSVTSVQFLTITTNTNFKEIELCRVV